MSSPNITTDENQAPRVDDLANAINDLAISGVKSETENIEWKQVAAEMEKIWEEQAIEKLTNLPNIDLPTDKLKSKLMRHQETGIKWMYGMETGSYSNPFVIVKDLGGGDVRYYNRVLKNRRLPHYEAPKGGLLADEMGVGKTLQTLCLILANPPKKDSDSKVNLLVCPKTVIPHWQSEIKKHLKDGTLSCTVYEGESRGRVLPDLNKLHVDILFVTYETLRAEYTKFKEKKGKFKTLFDEDIKFHRIILDEAHFIRDESKKSSKAVNAVNATYKLALTGTPFINKPDDIHSLLAFLNIMPINDKDVFRNCVTKPIMAKERRGLIHLRSSMSFAALRRTKGSARIDLTEKTVTLARLKFNNDVHKKIHDDHYKFTKLVMKALLSEDGSRFEGNAFNFTLRLRQACCHSDMVPDEYKTIVNEIMANKDLSNLTMDQAKAILNLLHVDKVGLSNQLDFSTRTFAKPSPKIIALLEAIEDIPRGEKAVVFSFFREFVDLIHRELQKEEVQVFRLDGRTEDRSAVIHGFSQKSSRSKAKVVLLCTIQSGGVGIDLSCANHAFIMDTWWNEAIENQAMDRVHRIGQTRPVHVTRFVMKDSIEDRLIEVQKSKALLGKGSMERLTKDEERRAKVATLKDIFELENGTAASSNGWIK